MIGERSLQKLIATMQPELDPESFVFVTGIPFADWDVSEDCILLVFKERDGVTLIVQKKYADEHEWSYQGVWRKITLNIHSSLEAVGFLATMSRVLADAGISVNAVSAFYHDHLFVLEENAETSLGLLQDLSSIR